MKNLINYAGSLTFCLLLLFCSGAQAADDYSKLSGIGQTAAVAQGVFQGTAQVNSNGKGRTANVTTYLLGAPTETEDGTLKANTAHNFVFADGSSFTTYDYAVLSPTGASGVYNLNTRAEIVSGTGDYQGASGMLLIHGTINLVTGQVIWRFSGKICV